MRQGKKRIRFTTAAASLVMAGALGLAAPGTGAAEPAVRDATHRTSVEVIYTGLNHPRKVTWHAQHGAVLVAEAGRKNTTCIGDTTNGCFSKTGSVFMYTPGGNDTDRVVTGLPALNSPHGLSGVSEVIPAGGDEGLAVFGLGGLDAKRAPYGEDGAPLGTVSRVTMSGQLTPMADPALFEERNNPDGGVADSNPFSIAPASNGDAVIVDAAANDVLRVGQDGSIDVLDVLPKIQYDGRQLEPVPTSVLRGPDGAYYIGELGGYPSVDASRVWRLVPGQEATLVAGGFTTIMDIAFDDKGRLLVLEYSRGGQASADPTGQLIRVEPDGQRTVLADTALQHPGGMAVAPGGDIYVSNNITGGDGAGQLLRISTVG